MKITCSCGASGEFRDSLAGAVDADKWNKHHEACRNMDNVRSKLEKLEAENSSLKLELHNLRNFTLPIINAGTKALLEKNAQICSDLLEELRCAERYRQIRAEWVKTGQASSEYEADELLDEYYSLK